MPDIPEEALQAAAEAARADAVARFREPIKPVAEFVPDVRHIVEAAADGIRADERRKVAEQIREIVYDDGPMPLPNWRAFKARHPRLITGDSVVAVVLAVADEVEGDRG